MLPAVDCDTTKIPFFSQSACLDIQLSERFGQRFSHYDTIRWAKPEKPNCIAYDDHYNDDLRVIRFTPLDRIAYGKLCPSEYIPTSFHAKTAQNAHLGMLAATGINVARFETLATETCVNNQTFDAVPCGVYFSQDYLGSDIFTLTQAAESQVMRQRCMALGKQLLDAMQTYREGALASDRQIIMFDVAFARQYAVDADRYPGLTLIDPEPYFEAYDSSTRAFPIFDAALATTIDFVRAL